MSERPHGPYIHFHRSAGSYRTSESSQPSVQDDWERIEDHSAQGSALIATHSTPLSPTLFPEKGAQWADEVINAKDKSTMLTGEAKEVEQEIELC